MFEFVSSKVFSSEKYNFFFSEKYNFFLPEKYNFFLSEINYIFRLNVLEMKVFTKIEYLDWDTNKVIILLSYESNRPWITKFSTF